MMTEKYCIFRRDLSFFLFIFSLLIASCTNGGGSTGQSSTYNIYAVGSSATDLDETTQAPVYWANNAIVELSRIDANCSGYANSIAVNGKDIHIAGTTFKCSPVAGTAHTPVAAYWKNGIRTDLERPAAHADEASEAQQVVVASGSVYVAGYVTGDSGKLPVYWKDGVIVYLNDIPYSGTKARASNIYVDGTDIYVSGAVLFDTPYPVYWKNGVAVTLPVPSGYSGSSVPLPIKISSGDVYVFGYVRHRRTQTDYDTRERAVYWKNGALVPLFLLDSGVGYAYGGTVYSGSPYSAGGYIVNGVYTPSLWVNQTRQQLSMIDEGLYGMAHDVFVSEAGTFVAGWTYQSPDPSDPDVALEAVPCVWFNNSRFDLARFSSRSAYAREIVVTK
jgi:hypothetical protein